MNFRAGMFQFFLASASLSLSGCVISMPFKGPKYSRSEGVRGYKASDEVVVVLTYAKVNNKIRGPFDEGTAQVNRTMESHEGLIGYSIRREIFGDEAWTMTVWSDEEAVERFSSSEVHRQAVKTGRPALVATKFRRLKLPASQIPLSWDQVEEFLRKPDRAYGEN